MKITLKHNGEEVEFDGAKDARELAIKYATAAKDFLDEKGGEDAPDDAYAHMQDILEDVAVLRKEWVRLSGREGAQVTLRETMEELKGTVTGDKRPLVNIGSFDQKSMGERFVESQAYRDLVESGDLKRERAQLGRGKAARVSEGFKAPGDLIRTGSGGGADALVEDMVLPGILGLPQRPLTVRELFGQAGTTSDTISYAYQTAFDSGAAPVSQATSLSTGLKPQSSIAWARTTSQVETIATWMATTRQALEDAAQVRGLIDNQGRLMIQLEEEDQLLSGSGTPPELRGLLNTPGVQALDLTAETYTATLNLDAIRTARRMIATGASRLQADAIVMNPVDSELIDLLKDGDGNYRGGNPVGGFQFNQTLWGLRRVESEAVPVGTAVIGAFRPGATVYERSPIEVYTSDSHADFFTRNLVAILFEERLGFVVFFPTAYLALEFGPWEAAPEV